MGNLRERGGRMKDKIKIGHLYTSGSRVVNVYNLFYSYYRNKDIIQFTYLGSIIKRELDKKTFLQLFPTRVNIKTEFED